MNELSIFLNKEQRDFTKQDILRYIKSNQIEAVNFRYIASDGRLKTLNFPANNLKYIDKILTSGERVDGSSLFKNIDTAQSDLYVIPNYSMAFLNPFSPVKTLDIICSFYDKDGNEFIYGYDNVLRKAENAFRKITGFEIQMLGELEYYVISDKNDLYPIKAQKGYHESYPFNKWEFLRVEAMNLIARTGAKVKYAHSEVGFIRTEDKEMIQNEIEFLPDSPLRSAYYMIIAKWILQSLGYKYNVLITFAPKISVGHAGSGLHIHSCVVKNGKNVMLDKKQNLSDNALKLIAGYLSAAKSITAFGNTVPTSYLRLVPNQEAPVRVCWGYRNRSALIRIPLAFYDRKEGWHQTVEFRAGDGSANISLYIASLISAALNGFKMKDYRKYTDKMFVDSNIFKQDRKIREKFEALPTSCYESAIMLEKDRKMYEAYGIFPPKLIDYVINTLKSYNDKNLSERLFGKEEEIKKLVMEYLYC